MRRSTSVAFALFLFATTPAMAQEPAPATGDPAANAALATELFNAGRDLMNAGNYAGACPKLSESARLDPKVGTLARLAECEEKQNHIAASRGRWQQALNLARAQSDSRIDHVKAEFERVDRITPKLHFRAEAPPADLSIKVDQTTIGIGAIDIPLPVDPGHHVITASAAGRVPWSGTVDTVADGATAEITIPQLAVDPNTAAVVAPAGPGTEQPKEPAKSQTPWPTIGLVGAGVGLVAIGVGIAFAAQAKSKYDDSLRFGCTGDNCNVQGAQIRNDARAAGNRSTAFVIAGSVLAAAGLGVFLFAPKPSKEKKTGWASARVIPDFGSLSVEGAW